MPDTKENEWHFQWKSFMRDERLLEDDLLLFKEWIHPVSFDDFTGKSVLDCGCGRGQHLKMLLPYVADAAGVDLNTVDVAREYLDADRGLSRGNGRATVYQGDLASFDLARTFDIVYSIGVLHHTDDPDSSFANIKKHARAGGRVIVWVYSWEGNFLNRAVLEPLKRLFFLRLGRRTLLALATLMTILLYAPVYTLYLLPARFLPFYDYFVNFRRLSFAKNHQNVFDKLNAPQTHFITRTTVERWFNAREFEQVVITPYAGVSWRATGILRK